MPVSRSHYLYLKNHTALTPNPELKGQSGKVDKRKAETIVRKLTSGRALGSEKGRAMLHEVQGALPKNTPKRPTPGR